ncbi:hypothetical protein A3D68_01315 [Candidatus Adlerbacteria bacterium RIFCSPHIGHO2_02_FULL_52_17]|uniref:Uncharacterized protein n=1 Tax=Candidatus Adlerbacteria bacterium RIFCSPHIGHO2_02_FULL_52_17 TaxID=1797240 RepID=A0A1F4XPS1_9BACT|nr:MAG: hypothetical protein A3D68_01315 [Candidatus Adlerbacteria bacterium RIFCSPHIGHO2_02_FULL_52_17]
MPLAFPPRACLAMLGIGACLLAPDKRQSSLSFIHSTTDAYPQRVQQRGQARKNKCYHKKV